MTAVCLHQPNFIPWTKLLAKIAASDVYVAYDSVQFTRTEYHNRQRLRARRGPVLLTVPVRRAKHRQLLCDVELDPTDKWRGHHLRIIEQEYRRAPFFTDIFPLVRDVYHHPHTTLVDFNLDLLGTFLTYLQIPTRIVRATDLPHHGDNTDRLIQLTAAVGGGEHITSTWGTERTYIDWHRVADAGLTIRPQHYVHPTYQQQFQPFEPHLGALDLMFAHGPDTTHTLRRSSTFPCAPTPSVTTHVARPHRSRDVKSGKPESGGQLDSTER